jgi:hypothetical protein
MGLCTQPRNWPVERILWWPYQGDSCHLGSRYIEKELFRNVGRFYRPSCSSLRYYLRAQTWTHISKTIIGRMCDGRDNEDMFGFVGSGTDLIISHTESLVA